MKLILKIIIGLIGLLILSCSLAAIIFFSNQTIIISELQNQGNYAVLESQEVSLDGIAEINIALTNEDLHVESYSGEDLILNLTGNSLENIPSILFSEEEGKLNIRIDRSTRETFPNDFRLYVKIPQNYGKDLKVVTLSGDSNIKELSLSGFIFESASGDASFDNLKSNYANFKSLSGDLDFDNSSIDSIKTTSGDIHVEGFYPKELNILSISGDVSLDLEEDSSITLDFSSLSGDLDNDLEGSIYSGENKVYVKTTSGDLSVY